jgi:hypothetical protein
VRDPNVVGTGWGIIVAADPDIVFAIPAIIAGDPHIARVGRRAGMFNDWRRWGEFDVDLRVGNGRDQRECKQCGEYELFHGV